MFWNWYIPSLVVFFFVIKWWTVAWQHGEPLSSISFFFGWILTRSMAWEVVYDIIYQRLLCRQESGSQCETFNGATWTPARSYWQNRRTPLICDQNSRVWWLIVSFLRKDRNVQLDAVPWSFWLFSKQNLKSFSAFHFATFKRLERRRRNNSNDLTFLCKKLTSGFDSCMSKLLTGRRFADFNRQNVCVCEQAKTKHQPKHNLVIYQRLQVSLASSSSI